MLTYHLGPLSNPVWPDVVAANLRLYSRTMMPCGWKNALYPLFLHFYPLRGKEYQ